MLLGVEKLDLSAERARLAREQADAQAIKNAELRGEVVRGEDVNAFVMRLAGALTQRMRAIAPKAAPEVRASATDAEAVVSELVDEALTELANAAREAGERAARRKRGAS